MQIWEYITSIVEGPGRPHREPLENFLHYIAERYSEDQKDKIEKFIASNAAKGKDVAKVAEKVMKYVAVEFMDQKANHLALTWAKDMGVDTKAIPGAEGPKSASTGGGVINRATGQSAGGQNRGVTKYPHASQTTSRDKGFSDEPIPTRPDRGEDPNLPSFPQKTLKPGEKYTQAVGTAGQNQPKREPTSDKQLPAWAVKKVPAGVSAVKQTYGKSPDAAYKTAAMTGGNVAVPANQLHKPMMTIKDKDGTEKKVVRPGTVIGQRWAPRAFTKMSQSEIDDAHAALEKNPNDQAAQAKLALAARLAGGASPTTPSQFANKATGQMQRTSRATNPEKPDSISLGKYKEKDMKTGKEVTRNVSWASEHEVIWCGDEYGWQPTSKYLVLSAQGKIPKRGTRTGPSSPAVAAQQKADAGEEKKDD